ncbi:hypothetical protein Rcae01_03291 [Novipirellula caenicola]|uniref:Uncharacterized protein n=1 Tax=Novipirellula caenicola TaxID=1536901 RepID=A0ABP9VWB9_9BACT
MTSRTLEIQKRHRNLKQDLHFRCDINVEADRTIQGGTLYTALYRTSLASKCFEKTSQNFQMFPKTSPSRFGDRHQAGKPGLK